MRRLLFLTCLLLLGGTSVMAQHDIVGVFADPEGTQNIIEVAPWTPFNIYLMIRNPTDPSGVYGCDVTLQLPENMVVLGWTYPVSGINFKDVPRFAVACSSPLPQAPLVIMAQAQCIMTDAEPAHIYVGPGAGDSSAIPEPLYAPGDLAKVDQFVTLTRNAPSPELPVFSINNVCGGLNQWTERYWEGPSERLNYGLVHDSQNEVTVLFGGSKDGVYMNDTWLWDGSRWTRVFPEHSPSTRDAMGMAYDEARERVVLFGGRRPTWLNDTWEWDGVDWTQVATTGPEPRSSMGFAYDPNLQVCVVYGGNCPTGRLDNTWQWDGTVWTQPAQIRSPSSRSLHSMAYDPGLQRIIMFGGHSAGSSGTYLGDTWSYDGVNWDNLYISGPSPRGVFGMARHGSCGCIYIYGGLDETDTHEDLWKFEGGAWIQVDAGPSAPGPRCNHQMAFDPAEPALLFFGGSDGDTALGDLWYYAPWDGITGVLPETPRVPETRLETNYPNPFNPSTTIRFSTSTKGPVDLTVYDLRGRPVRVLLADELGPGNHERIWDGKDSDGMRVASGFYVYRLTTRTGSYEGRMMLIK
jgi:hypothetical protein